MPSVNSSEVLLLAVFNTVEVLLLAVFNTVEVLLPYIDSSEVLLPYIDSSEVPPAVCAVYGSLLLYVRYMGVPVVSSPRYTSVVSSPRCVTYQRSWALRRGKRDSFNSLRRGEEGQF